MTAPAANHEQVEDENSEYRDPAEADAVNQFTVQHTDRANPFERGHRGDRGQDQRRDQNQVAGVAWQKQQIADIQRRRNKLGKDQ